MFGWFLFFTKLIWRLRHVSSILQETKHHTSQYVYTEKNAVQLVNSEINSIRFGKICEIFEKEVIFLFSFIYVILLITANLWCDKKHSKNSSKLPYTSHVWEFHSWISGCREAKTALLDKDLGSQSASSQLCWFKTEKHFPFWSHSELKSGWRSCWFKALYHTAVTGTASDALLTALN